MQTWERFKQHFRGYNSKAYEETMESVEKLASGCFALLCSKSEEERGALFARTQTLSEQITNMVGNEPPLVASLALLMSTQIYEQHVAEQAKMLRAMK